MGGVNCIQTFFGFLDFFYIYTTGSLSLESTLITVKALPHVTISSTISLTMLALTLCLQR